MSVIGIKNRLTKLEDQNGIGRMRVVVIAPGQTEAAAFAKSGLKLGDEAHVLRVQLVSTRPAA